MEPYTRSRSRFPATGVSTVRHSAVTGLLAARHIIARQAAVLENIDLEYFRVLADQPNVLDRGRPHGRQAVWHLEIAGSTRDGRFTVTVKQIGRAGRRDHQRPADRFAKQGRSDIDRADVAEVGRHQLVVIKGRRIATQRPFVIRTTVKIMEHRCRQPAFRKSPEVHDIETSLDAHMTDYAV